MLYHHSSIPVAPAGVMTWMWCRCRQQTVLTFLSEMLFLTSSRCYMNVSPCYDSLTIVSLHTQLFIWLMAAYHTQKGYLFSTQHPHSIHILHLSLGQVWGLCLCQAWNIFPIVLAKNSVKKLLRKKLPPHTSLVELKPRWIITHHHGPTLFLYPRILMLI